MGRASHAAGLAHSSQNSNRLAVSNANGSTGARGAQHCGTLGGREPWRKCSSTSTDKAEADQPVRLLKYCLLGIIGTSLAAVNGERPKTEWDRPQTLGFCVLPEQSSRPAPRMQYRYRRRARPLPQHRKGPDTPPQKTGPRDLGWLLPIMAMRRAHRLCFLTERDTCRDQ